MSLCACLYPSPKETLPVDRKLSYLFTSQVGHSLFVPTMHQAIAGNLDHFYTNDIWTLVMTVQSVDSFTSSLNLTREVRDFLYGNLFHRLVSMEVNKAIK